MVAAMIPTPPGMETLMWKATMLHQSGLLPQHIKTVQQVITIDMMAQELSIPTWQAINGINVIQGKPTVSPQLMLALIERSGKLEDIKVDSTAERCVVTMKRRGRSPHTETFSIKDAQAMQLSGKDNYRKQPAVMLKWRAISACARVVFPDVLMGMYTTEEIAPDTVRIDAEGDFEVIEAPQATNVTNIEVARQTLGSGDPSKERRIPQRDIIVTDGTSALAPQPEIEQPVETEQPAPNGTHAPTPGGDVPKDPKPSENAKDEGKYWDYDFQALMLHDDVKALYSQSTHRANVIKLLADHQAFAKVADVKGAAWKVKIYHAFRADGQSEDDAVAATVSAPDPLAGF